MGPEVAYAAFAALLLGTAAVICKLDWRTPTPARQRRIKATPSPLTVAQAYAPRTRSDKAWDHLEYNRIQYAAHVLGTFEIDGSYPVYNESPVVLQEPVRRVRVTLRVPKVGLRR